MDYRPSKRLNPFQEDFSSSSVLKNIYEPSSEEPTEGEVFFDDPFKDAGAQSSVSELEGWILQCKHMYLTSRNKSQQSQKFFLKRLIELRRLLYSAKEWEVNSTNTGPSSENCPQSSSPICTNNVLGHTFRSVSSIRFFGTICDSCSRPVISPTGNILICRNCCVTCHDSSNCIQGLLRHCPAAPANPGLTLELSRIAQLGASLSAQCWSCWSCKIPLRPPQATTHTSLSSPTFFQDSRSTFYDLKSLPTELAASIQRMEHTPTLNEVCLKQVTSAVQEISGVFSPTLGPVQTPADVCVVLQQRRLGSEKAPGVAKMCFYSGKFYCSNCHWGDAWCIPSNVFSMGITAPFPVSRDSLIALQYMWPRQLFRAPEGWQRWNAQAVLVASLRLRVHRLLPTYFRLCQKANDLRNKFEETQPTWLIEQPFTYTMEIVEQVLDSSLIESMTEFLIQVEDHVTNCVLCVTLSQSRCHVCGQSCPQPHHHCSTVCSVCHNIVHRTCVEPPLKADFDDLQSNLMTLKSQHDCPDALKVEDILETMYPASKPTRCKLCCE
nr:pleckstrin y domain containing family M [Hymenolepis microstoma]